MSIDNISKFVRCVLCKTVIEASWYEGTSRDIVPPGCPNADCSGLVGDTEELSEGVCEHGIWRIKCNTCSLEDALAEIVRLRMELEKREKQFAEERVIFLDGGIPYIDDNGEVQAILRRPKEPKEKTAEEVVKDILESTLGSNNG